MKTYTLHLPRDGDLADREALEGAELVKDGFSWGAFVFTFLWFFVQRLWLAGLGVLLFVVVLQVVLALLDVQPAAALAAQILASLLVGLEANALKRWTYGRHGRPAIDVVTADDEEEAELKAFARQIGAEPARLPATGAPAPRSVPVYRGPEPVIGLFPDPETRR